jgi:hypothetical protein
MCLATNPQIGYLRMLLHQAGYSIQRMDNAAPFMELGATMKECRGSVEDWLKGMSAARASRLIKRLKWQCKLDRSIQRRLKELSR